MGGCRIGWGDAEQGWGARRRHPQALPPSLHTLSPSQHEPLTQQANERCRPTCSLGAGPSACRTSITSSARRQSPLRAKALVRAPHTCRHGEERAGLGRRRAAGGGAASARRRRRPACRRGKAASQRMTARQEWAWACDQKAQAARGKHAAVRAQPLKRHHGRGLPADLDGWRQPPPPHAHERLYRPHGLVGLGVGVDQRAPGGVGGGHTAAHHVVKHGAGAVCGGQGSGSGWGGADMGGWRGHRVAEHHRYTMGDLKRNAWPAESLPDLHDSPVMPRVPGTGRAAAVGAHPPAGAARWRR